MLSKKLHDKISYSIKWLQKFSDRIWYSPLIGLLAALDNVIVIVPTDGILISSSMLNPKKWFMLALIVAIGSTIGAFGLAALVELKGLPWILEIYPGLSSTKTWNLSIKFFEQYGLLVVFFVAVTPVMQHPAVILASLANTPLIDLALVVFSGRFIKYLIMAYIGSHTPRLLNKMWGLKTELKDAGIQIK